jgi:hypothetical protein
VSRAWIAALFLATACGPGDAAMGEFCKKDRDCESERCLIRTAGNYCTMECKLDSDCPADYGCALAGSVGKGANPQEEFRVCFRKSE